MSLLVKSAAKGRTMVQLAEGRLQYVGFAAYRLSLGESLPVNAGDRELCLVLLSGRIGVQGEAPGQGAFGWDNLGDRQSVFEDKSPFAVYLPPGSQAQVTALSDVQIAVCAAPGATAKSSATNGLGPRLILPENMKRSVRGKGANTRYVCDILPDSEPAHSLLVVEVRTPSGHSSSYPPHKHDTDDLPHQSFLEETYYHQVNPPQGFVFQRVYTDDRSIDEAMAVEHGDLVVVPRGYHPVSVPYGYESYYLNVMAGPKRVWQFHNDPRHSWLLDL
ncbi:5-deoxy-glucuronate isomerase [Pseudomonas chlororaphis]|uniref:5-deoxy-glucuronate isomerase n=1 Tax=Pseudomonas chlororaphis TaxID=587753 RepID=UPI0006A5B34B|nr:5-deoxy-glucuronate isomerase [Pseudomonas chlororaphis]AZD01781.1 5-deoxy-glucuronate isomerase [Pseudomonas chlororaphis subsp. chlororaphis]MBM0282969.1 5-deoxy-glucuronate isomerase [Pseudomonas chlororaphis]MDO1507302.1 5-deoxy-glucuronate isomerase [Pseudomonas chlororaphis]ORM45408.1 5-deoxy-glucuronate isomerase [Pseudomonas chlororaphis subsp. chlororaphis]TWR98707.1 5-deoxy-glucuronate isomerase [Pseudomonas chlororaphis subsp. chlororaphis]